MHTIEITCWGYVLLVCHAAGGTCLYVLSTGVAHCMVHPGGGSGMVPLLGIIHRSLTLNEHDTAGSAHLSTHTLGCTDMCMHSDSRGTEAVRTGKVSGVAQPHRMKSN